jgi:hypothetical protein
MKAYITYFKHTGKYYTDVVINVPDDMEIYNIFKLIHKQLRDGTLPGLSGNHNNYFVHINVPDHEYSYPAILLPLKIEKFIKNPLVASSF